MICYHKEFHECRRLGELVPSRFLCGKFVNIDPAHVKPENGMIWVDVLVMCSIKIWNLKDVYTHVYWLIPCDYQTFFENL